jgi:hypothetical protein
LRQKAEISTSKTNKISFVNDKWKVKDAKVNKTPKKQNINLNWILSPIIEKAIDDSYTA